MDAAPLQEKRQVSSVKGFLNYQAASVERTLVANGKIFSKRNTSGDTSRIQGASWTPTEVVVRNGRFGSSPELETHGFELVQRGTSLQYEDFYREQEVVRRYYPECINLVKAATGADVVVAFDHNLRSASGKSSRKRLQGGSNVQEPAALVHGDYTLTSGPVRLRQLAQPPRVNDTLGNYLDGKPAVSAEALRAAHEGRYAIVNVWRNVRGDPVETFPLACCHAKSAAPEDLCVFEIHYEDRVGENYFAAHADRHEWYYFPQMERSEAMLIKQWDSASTLSGGDRVPFALHTAFVDPSAPADANDRESIEVRCMCIFDSAGVLASPPSSPMQSKL